MFYEITLQFFNRQDFNSKKKLLSCSSESNDEEFWNDSWKDNWR